MARPMKSWWKSFAVVSVLSAFFVATVSMVVPGVALAAATYSFKSAEVIAVAGYDKTLNNYPDTENFDFSCSQNPRTAADLSGIQCTAISVGTCVPVIRDFVKTGSDFTAQVTWYTGDNTTASPCRQAGTQRVAIAPGNTNGSNGTGAGDDIQFDCGKPFSLNWFLCPLYFSVNGIVGQIDNMINTLLTIDQKAIFDTSTDSGKGYYQAWQTLRTLAVAILVIAALIMVIAQAFGLEVFDAYTIKKVLPRLIIAIIAIAISWQLMEFFVVFTNVLGQGIREIIYAPFQNFPGALQLGGTSALLAGLLSAGALVALGAAGLLSFAVTALLAALVAFLVLMVRQLVIIVLILVAPIAIACSILPNTNGAYKLWYESFTKALLMFPIIVAFIAVGRVFAVVAIQGDISQATAVNQLIGFAAYFLPYFLIPMTFSLAGGAMRFIGGKINDTNRGAFDRLKKYRAGKTQANFHAMKQGTRYRDNNMVARGFNRFTQNAAMAPSGGVNPWQFRSRFQAAKTQQAYDEAEEIRTKNADFALGAQDDRLLRAVRGKGRGEVRQILQREGFSGAGLDTAVGTVERMQHAGSRDAVLQAAALQRFATGTGYTYKDANGEDYFDYQEAMDTIKEASEGDRALAGRILGSAKGTAAGAGQLAFGGASYGTLSGGLDQSFAGQRVDGSKIALNAFEGNDGSQWARARAPHVRAAYRAASDRVNELRNGAAPRDAGEYGRLTAQLESSAQLAGMYGAPEKQTVVNNELAGSEGSRQELRQRNSQEDFGAVYDFRTGERMTPRSADNTQFGRNQSSRGGRTADPNDPRMREEG